MYKGLDLDHKTPDETDNGLESAAAALWKPGSLLKRCCQPVWHLPHGHRYLKSTGYSADWKACKT